MILVTGATGMFGSRTFREVRNRGADVAALVRDADRGRRALGPDATLVVGDMDRPETLDAAMDGVDTVFLVSPMDDRIADRELATVDAAHRAGVRRIVKLHGAVRHEDALGALHRRSIDAIAGSGMRWALLSPNSVMETSLYSQAAAIQASGEMWGCAGDGRVGLVAADDVGRAAAAVLVDRGDAADGTDFRITGPEALSMADMARTLTSALGREVGYHDLPEDEFLAVLVQQTGMPAEVAEIAVVAHFRAWRQGLADLVTDTYTELTSLPPTSLADWAADHASAFTGDALAGPSVPAPAGESVAGG
ncbi:NmrA family NAD(P)-binding protein [Nakamurella endophytica]|uniref:NAD(P)-dependent oxidoreductase n=1 Tax=Nakamurella endophytica TaxID=1748367 RepID=A0A917TDS0_9ACTN|nr:NmrA family NAD(P)-binding protein [Nakamurella endophytica]GGM19097.1 NAD(P)-dependent oxidoreductase [Nakamurella endophytica]